MKQRVIPVDKQRKLELFCHLLRRQRWPQVLVFAKTRKRVDELVTSLQYQEVSTAAIHGDIPQHARLAALRRFNAGQVRVLVATDVAARGLDIEALPLVVNLDLPIAPDAAGRDRGADRQDAGAARGRGLRAETPRTGDRA